MNCLWRAVDPMGPVDEGNKGIPDPFFVSRSPSFGFCNEKSSCRDIIWGLDSVSG